MESPSLDPAGHQISYRYNIFKVPLLPLQPSLPSGALTFQVYLQTGGDRSSGKDIIKGNRSAIISAMGSQGGRDITQSVYTGLRPIVTWRRQSMVTGRGAGAALKHTET